jgi:hypothetical protein
MDHDVVVVVSHMWREGCVRGEHHHLITYSSFQETKEWR